MSPKQKAVVLSDLVALQQLAMQKAVYHENEAGRYRREFGHITNRIMQLQDIQEPDCILASDDFVTVNLKRYAKVSFFERIHKRMQENTRSLTKRKKML